MSSTTAPAAAEGLPKFDPDTFDASLYRLSRLTNLILDTLGDIDRDVDEVTRQKLDSVDALAWATKSIAKQISDDFEPYVARLRKA